MDDLSEKISSLLSDPEGMARIQKMAQSVLGGTDAASKEPGEPNIDIGKLMPLISKINSRSHDSRTGLLLALRPHLSEKRRERLDSAVKILRVIDMLPLLQDSGLFNL